MDHFVLKFILLLYSFVVEGIFYPVCWEKRAIFCLEFNRPTQVRCHDKTFCTDILVADVFPIGKGWGLSASR